MPVTPKKKGSKYPPGFRRNRTRIMAKEIAAARAGSTYKRRFGLSTLKSMIKDVSARQSETKTTIVNYSDARQWLHMSINDLDANPWSTLQGVTNPASAANNSSAQNNRIGDEILAKGVRYKIFVENNERFPCVYHRFMFVRCARGQVIDKANVFMGRSDNKMIDDIDRQKITVMYDRTFKISGPNLITASQVQNQYSGVNAGTYNNSTLPGALTSQPGSKVITLYIPYKKDNKYHKLQYTVDGGATPKFYDYHLLYMPYVLYNTSDTLDVSKFNDMNKVFYFKDP